MYVGWVWAGRMPDRMAMRRTALRRGARTDWAGTDVCPSCTFFASAAGLLGQVISCI
jgi:hypothetical protein